MDTGSLEMEGVSLERRRLLRLLLMTPLLSAFAGTAAEASPLNPSETFVMQPTRFSSSHGRACLLPVARWRCSMAI